MRLATAGGGGKTERNDEKSCFFDLRSISSQLAESVGITAMPSVIFPARDNVQALHKQSLSVSGPCAIRVRDNCASCNILTAEVLLESGPGPGGAGPSDP